MTDAEKIAQHEQKIAEQDQRLIAMEKNGVAFGDRVKQNAKDIRRVEAQAIDRFEHLVNLMNEGFNRVEGQTIKWLSLVIAVAVIILGILTYMKG